MKRLSRIKEVEKNVLKLLELHWHLRNDDNALIIVYWRTYDDFETSKPYRIVTAAGSIIRARQKLQAKGYYLPTDPKVIAQRKKKEMTIRDYSAEWIVA